VPKNMSHFRHFVIYYEYGVEEIHIRWAFSPQCINKVLFFIKKSPV